jgi:uncharacterized protein
MLTRFDDVDAFLAEALPFLAAREAEHNLMLGISSSLGRSDGVYEARPYLAIVRTDHVVAAALRTPPYNLVLSEVDDPVAVKLLVDDLRGEALPGAVGPPGAVMLFADGWVAANGGSWRVALEERIFRLARVVPPQPAPGAPHLATPDVRPLLERWLVDFGREALDEADADRVRIGLDDWERGGGRRFWLWEVDERPVSLAGAGGETPNGIRIGPVYTPPEDRGRGYASNLTAWVSQAMLDEGRSFCFLYTDLANPTANAIYQAIGYEPVTDARMVRFG